MVNKQLIKYNCGLLLLQTYFCMILVMCGCKEEKDPIKEKTLDRFGLSRSDSAVEKASVLENKA